MSRVIAALAKLVGVVLIGAGIAGLLALLGAQEAALYLGMLGVLIGGVFVSFTNTVSWWPRIRRGGQPLTDGDRSEVLSLFGSGYGRAAILGLVGLGLVIGSAIASTSALMAAGAAGVAAALLTAGRGSRDIR